MGAAAMRKARLSTGFELPLDGEVMVAEGAVVSGSGAEATAAATVR